MSWEVVGEEKKGLPGINQVTIVGNIGKTPEVSTLQSERKMLKFSVATNEFKEKKDRTLRNTQWHKVVVYDPLASTLIKLKLLNKGTRVAVMGRLSSSDYTTEEGHKIRNTEIEVENIFPWVTDDAREKAEELLKEAEELLKEVKKAKGKEDTSLSEFTQSDEIPLEEIPQDILEMKMEPEDLGNIEEEDTDKIIDLDQVMEKGFATEEEVCAAARQEGDKHVPEPFT